jgi:hypothetical protein
MKHRLTILAAACSLFVATAAFSQWGTCTGGSVTCTNSAVGIGTTTPTGGSSLDVLGSSQNSYFRSASSGGFSRIFVNNDAGGGFYMLAYGSAFGGTYAGQPTANLTLLLGTSATNGLIVGTSSHQPIIFSVFGADNLHIDTAGNVGIGTATPGAKLDVNGAINVSGNIAAKYQDVAEWVSSEPDLANGTVVVLSSEIANHVVESTSAYDTKIAGVISEHPGLILGEPADDKSKVATTGRVRIKVDATKHPIRIGDLLVTSDTPGYAMKSEPVDLGGIKMHRPGTIIGKALDNLPSGRGEILVLLSLQ